MSVSIPIDNYEVLRILNNRKKNGEILGDGIVPIYNVLLQVCEHENKYSLTKLRELKKQRKISANEFDLAVLSNTSVFNKHISADDVKTIKLCFNVDDDESSDDDSVFI